MNKFSEDSRGGPGPTSQLERQRLAADTNRRISRGISTERLPGTQPVSVWPPPYRLENGTPTMFATAAGEKFLAHRSTPAAWR